MNKYYKHLEIKSGPKATHIDTETAAKWLGRNVRTIERWIDGNQKPCCKSAYEILKLRGLGIIPLDTWDGWTITQDKLYNPDGLFFDQGILNAYQVNLALLRELKNENRTLREATKLCAANDFCFVERRKAE